MKPLRAIKYLYQRLTRGWDDTDIWCLDMTYAKWILPRLNRFQEVKMSYPAEFINPNDDMDDSGFDKWKSIVGQMIEAFELILDKENDPEWICQKDAPQHRMIEEGLALFAKHYNSLWW